MAHKHKQLPRTVLWRRSDLEGMDACAFDHCSSGYRISGTALYCEHGKVAKFEYDVRYDAAWASRSARVEGWVGSSKKVLDVFCDADGHWITDGGTISGVGGLLDIDLGFTPATNTSAIKRLGLDVMGQAETTAVWLDTNDWRFKPLRQVYQRLSDTEFAYSSPDHSYSTKLLVDDFGIVQQYPGFWSVVSG